MIFECTDKKIEYGKKIILMGIVNVTPDSFSDGGDNFETDKAVAHALELIDDGANIIDIGAQSTRPGCTSITQEEEFARLEPVLRQLRAKTDVPISIDTFYPYVAEKSLEMGADIINDVSGTVSQKMAKIVKLYHAGWIIMHNGSGKTDDVKQFFKNCAEKCRNIGIDKNQICFDMGIGFGKSYDENMALIANVSKYKLDSYPLLLGTSRKRVIAQGSNQEKPKQRIYGNIAADTVAIMGGVDIIRLHDIKNEKQGILMAQNLKGFIDNG